MKLTSVRLPALEHPAVGRAPGRRARGRLARLWLEEGERLVSAAELRLLHS